MPLQRNMQAWGASFKQRFNAVPNETKGNSFEDVFTISPANVVEMEQSVRHE